MELLQWHKTTNSHRLLKSVARIFYVPSFLVGKLAVSCQEFTPPTGAAPLSDQSKMGI